jgi:hypothetical protein
MYHEVTMIEFREVLRLWQEQVPKKRIAAQLGLDPKTVRRYLRAAEAAGWELRWKRSATSRCATYCWRCGRAAGVPTARTPLWTAQNCR